jgi:hypothetical protein
MITSRQKQIYSYMLFDPTMANPWDAFGGDDDIDDDLLHDPSQKNCQYDTATAIITALVQCWIKHADVVSMQHCRILVVSTGKQAINTSPTGQPNTLMPVDDIQMNFWKEIFASKMIHDVTIIPLETHNEVQVINGDADHKLYDAIIWLSPTETQSCELYKLLLRTTEFSLIPGGYLVVGPFSTCSENQDSSLSDAFLGTAWDLDSAVRITVNKDTSFVWNLPKWTCTVANETCTWLSKKHSVVDECRLATKASVTLSVQERESGYLNSTSIQKAALSLTQHGYCIVSGLLYSQIQTCRDYGAAAVSDVQAASAILKNEGIDLFEPSQSSVEAGTYRELSMREDYRIDIRHGPALEALRGRDGNSSITYKASVQEDNNNFLRGNAAILAIVRRAMNPSTPKDRCMGNYGRYNFGGSGPDGSDRDLVAGPVGAIVNLPGSSDQAIHADTPHLFEHIIEPSPLPPHYINIFTLGCLPMDNVGQTALIHGSHSLEFVTGHLKKDSFDPECRDPFVPALWRHLVRPRMNLGDILLFDCRILHFGLANRHPTIPRPMLYVNMTLHWFHDPKNWDEHARIFNSNDQN